MKRILIALIFIVCLGFVFLYIYSGTLRKISDDYLSGPRPVFKRMTERAEEIIISRSPLIVSDFYQTSEKRPLILLVHGSDSKGRKNGLIRLLAEGFQSDGFPVLAVDLSGFGESDDPSMPLTESFRFENNVIRAAKYAMAHNLSPTGEIIYMGHSLGAGVILKAGRNDPRPSAIVAIGTPDTRARFQEGGEDWKRRFAKGRFKHMKMEPDDQSIKILGKYLLEMDAGTQVNLGDLPPVLLIYGEKERGIKTGRNLVKTYPGKIGFHSVPQAPHDYQTRGIIGGLAFFNQEMLESVITASEAWIMGHSKIDDHSSGHLGTFAKWSKVEIKLKGPFSVGTSRISNPFQKKATVSFISPEKKIYIIPAFYDGDGEGGMDGDVWKANFSPDSLGLWFFSSRGIHPSLNSTTGTFHVMSPPENATLFEKWGRLNYAENHYLKFADGPYWLKGGTNEPEDFLSTEILGGWEDKKEAVNYLAEQHVNSIYLMTNTIAPGDGNNVWPWFGTTPQEAKKNHEIFDVARLNAWEDLFQYIQSKGIVIHLVLDDDSAWEKYNRKMYYREMVARFAHHNGLYWNISEEYHENYSSDDVKAFAQQIRNLDPYDHPISVHVSSNDDLWLPFIGDSRFDITSLQTKSLSPSQHNAVIQKWREKTSQNRRPLAISIDEGRPGNSLRNLWAVYLGGGMWEAFVPSVRTKGFQAEESFWKEMRFARTFLESFPFWEMVPSNELANRGFVFAKPGEHYVVYLSNGGTLVLDLSDMTGPLPVVWYNPRTGVLMDKKLTYGGEKTKFKTPDEKDWVLSIGKMLNRNGINLKVDPVSSIQ